MILLKQTLISLLSILPVLLNAHFYTYIYIYIDVLQTIVYI